MNSHTRCNQTCVQQPPSGSKNVKVIAYRYLLFRGHLSFKKSNWNLKIVAFVYKGLLQKSGWLSAKVRLYIQLQWFAKTNRQLKSKDTWRSQGQTCMYSHLPQFVLTVNGPRNLKIKNYLSEKKDWKLNQDSTTRK